MINKKVKLFIVLSIFASLFSVSFWSWSWKYYQIYTSKWDSRSSTIYNGLLNNNLSSSYYIDSSSLSASNNTIDRKEWDILFVVQENWEFDSLKWFNVTDYDGARDYFTAYYNWQNFASAICHTFRAWNVITVHVENGWVYKNLAVNWVVKKVKIATLSPNMSILAEDGNLSVKNSWTLKVKIINWYTSCRDPKSIVSYRLLYFTRYKRDVSAPTARVSSNLTKEDGSPYTQWTWSNQNVLIKLDCIDNPDPVVKRNSGCLDSYQIKTVTSHLLSTDQWLYWWFYDNSEWGSSNWNLWAWYIQLNVPIDKTKPFVSRFDIIWKHDLTEDYDYILSKSVSDYDILADNYDFRFTVKDKSNSCDADGNCRWVSGIKYIKIFIDGNQLPCSKTYPEYNVTKWLVPEDRVDFVCSLDLTQVWNSWNKDLELKASIEDFAGNVYEKSWNLHVKPNKPYPDNFSLVCMDGTCASSIYSTNEDSDYFKFGFYIKDRFWNLVKKQIEDIRLDDSVSYIDKDIYDGNDSDDGNALTLFDKNLNLWIWVAKVKSVVPGTFWSKFKFYMKAFDTSFTDTNEDWEFEKDFSMSNSFVQPIVWWSATIYDMNWNLVWSDDFEPLEWYKVSIPISNISFDDYNYYYNIWNITTSTFTVYPTETYQTVWIRNIHWNIKNFGSTPDWTLTFEFRYNLKAWAILDKTPSFKFNPSVTLTSHWKTWLFPLYANWLNIGSSEDMKFKFSVIWFKTAYGQTFAIGQWRKEFNIVPSEIKAKIKQNAYKYVNSLKPNVVSNWVLVIDWDYNLDSSEYSNLLTNKVKTLIVKNGNLTISTNIPKRLDIAVVVDNPNYEITSSTINDYLSDWNIKIKPNVTFINWLLYAEKSILPVDNNGVIISSETPDKYTQLKNQLLFYGTLVSKNTIWGSIMDINWDYMLPWGKRTDNLYLASLFDIAFLRRGSNLFDQLPNSKYNNGIDDYVIVRYNPDLKLNPWILLK